jgi:hypothetical protein
LHLLQRSPSLATLTPRSLSITEKVLTVAVLTVALTAAVFVAVPTGAVPTPLDAPKPAAVDVVPAAAVALDSAAAAVPTA